MLQARRTDPHPLARAFRRHRGVARNRCVLQRAEAPRRSRSRGRACLNSSSRSKAPESVARASMPELVLTIEGAEVVQYAAAPLLAFKLRVASNPSDQIIHTVALRAQIQIEATRRKYDANEQARLADLFGEPDRWGQTLRSMLWTHASVVVPRFAASAVADISVPCTFDFNVAATKYFHGVTNGDLPLCFQFSGTVFYQGDDETLQVAPISWDKEAKYRLP